jgi:hypothetical protein
MEIAKETPGRFIPSPGWSYRPAHVQPYDVIIYFLLNSGQSLVRTKLGVEPPTTDGGCTYFNGRSPSVRPGERRVSRADAQQAEDGRRNARIGRRRGKADSGECKAQSREHSTDVKSPFYRRASIHQGHERVTRGRAPARVSAPRFSGHGGAGALRVGHRGP